MKETSLNFPCYEYIKSLPLDKEYRWIIFETGLRGVNGILTWNEDFQKLFYFDVTIGGYTGESGLGKSFKGTKGSYNKMCKYITKVYEDMLKSMNQDLSWQWNDKMGE